MTENIVAKVEIAHHGQVLLLFSFFQNSFAVEALESDCLLERIQLSTRLFVHWVFFNQYMKNIFVVVKLV